MLAISASVKLFASSSPTSSTEFQGANMIKIFEGCSHCTVLTSLFCLLLGIFIVILQRSWTSGDWKATSDRLNKLLRAESSEKKFISRHALQTILSSHQVEKLLSCAPKRDRKQFLDHIIAHGLQLLAIHLLDGSHERIQHFLQQPLESDDQAFFEASYRVGDYQQWQRPPRYSKEAFKWVFDLHWQIPPILRQASIVRYPKNFVIPFFDDKFCGSGSYGTVYSAKLGGGHITGYAEVRAPFLIH